MAMAQRARELKAAGVGVLDFSTGEPDFDTPGHVQDAAVRALREGFTHYTPSKGFPELLEAIAGRFQRQHGYLPDAASQIIVTPGAKQAILTTLMAVLDDGDEVLLPAPCWVSYAEMVRMVGGRPVYVPASEEEGFIPGPEALRRGVSDKTKVIIFNNPCNPTAVVWDRESLEGVLRLAEERDLLVVADEVYDEIVFDVPFTSFLQLDGAASRTVVINGWSKTYAMTGWRLGYLVAPASIVEAALPLHQNSATCVASFAQQAAIAALSGPQDCVEEMVRAYANRRHLLLEGVRGIERISCPPIDGTFYAFVNIRGMGMASLEAAEYLLDRAHIVTTPGCFYGEGGDDYLRFSFAVPESRIKDGFSRLKDLLQGA